MLTDAGPAALLAGVPHTVMLADAAMWRRGAACSQRRPLALYTRHRFCRCGGNGGGDTVVDTAVGGRRCSGASMLQLRRVAVRRVSSNRACTITASVRQTRFDHHL